MTLGELKTYVDNLIAQYGTDMQLMVRRDRDELYLDPLALNFDKVSFREDDLKLSDEDGATECLIDYYRNFSS
jgi:hypothetical protein